MIVVGAGAAGIIAAWRAAALGADVTLLEKNDRIGVKILISGGGKCNITHAGTVEDVLAGFRRNEARFLRPSCYRFTNDDIVNMLTARGLDVYTRPDGRIFPVDKNAKDVVAILRGYLAESGVDVRLRSAVTGIDVDANFISGVETENGHFQARHVIIATGGSSYPASGTTGDGFKWAAKLGHSICKVRPALAPIIMQSRPPDDWAGVALRDCVLRARQNGMEIARWRGDLLFTHRGISGPTVLGISREVAERLETGGVQLDVDLIPSRTFEALDLELREYVEMHPRRTLAAFTTEHAPERLAGAILESAGIDQDTKGAYLTQKSRNRLVAVLKGWPLGDAAGVPLEKGEVVAGGVSLDEVDAKSMRSAMVNGLYLCGEVLDIAGPVGGYNLQAAFATGFVAGESAARDAVSGVSNSD